MDFLETLLDKIKAFFPAFIALALFIIILAVLRRIFERRTALSSEYSFRRQLIILGVSFVGLLVVILLLPIGDTTRGQLLGLLGILLSAAIALSSTTLVGNAMAGIMLRTVRGFRPGDYIKIGDHFGRVSDRGLFHVELQTQDRDLTTLPNTYLVTNPVTVVRASGTIVSAKVSLGYDIPFEKIKDALDRAAVAAGLQDPFVHVMDLGDFAVTYRVAGLLADTKYLISTRSRLREFMMAHLHGSGIEIVSPTFMNTRTADSRTFVPVTPAKAGTEEQGEVEPETVIFDKADEAASLERLRELRQSAAEELEKTKDALKAAASEDENRRLQAYLKNLEGRLERLDELILYREDEKES